MSNPILTAAVVIEANGAALNNAGHDSGQRLDNALVVKQLVVGRKRYPYVSGQAMRRWWREVLYSDFDWKPSPVTREAKIAYTQGDPIQYPDDDMFGYMAARKSPKKKGKTEQDLEEKQSLDNDEPAAVVELLAGESGTQKRVSPLKNSLLVSVLPNAITTDLGVLSRNMPADNPHYLPFEYEHYTSPMQGVFSISLQDVGRFECGPMRDLPMEGNPAGLIEVKCPFGKPGVRTLMLNTNTRCARIADTVMALSRLRHGANLTRNLSDVAPVIVLLGFLDGGNAPFQNLFGPTDEGIAFKLDRLRSVLKDYADRILKQKTLYFGYRPGVLTNESEVLATLKQPLEGILFEVGSPGEMIKKVAQIIRTEGIVPETPA